MSDREATCAERIGAHRDSRVEDFRDLTQIACGGFEDLAERDRAAERQGLPLNLDNDLQELAQERIYEYPLGVSVETVVRVDLSTGGPGDWLEVMVSREPHYWAIDRIVYHFNDWFDHAEVELEGDDLKAAESFCETIGISEPGVIIPEEIVR